MSLSTITKRVADAHRIWTRYERVVTWGVPVAWYTRRLAWLRAYRRAERVRLALIDQIEAERTAFVNAGAAVVPAAPVLGMRR
jgi:hypothetical protein